MHSLIFGPVLAILGSVVIPALVGWRSCSHCLLVVVVLLTAYGALNFFIDPRRDGFKLVVWAHPHRAKFEAVIRAGYEIPSL